MVDKVYCVPGNPGIARIRKCACIPDIKPDNFGDLFDLIDAEQIDLTVPGSEGLLCAGLVDRFCERFRLSEHRIFGPKAKPAEIEGSKAYAHRFMEKYGIPTGKAIICENYQDAEEVVKRWVSSGCNKPLVIKADGLAAGKGTILAHNPEEAYNAIDKMMVQRIFGAAGDVIVFMEFLEGEELSIFVLVDGTNYVIINVPCQDHKRLLDGDEGPNTGGMGAYGPVSIATPGLMACVEKTIIEPTVWGLVKKGHPFVGILYCGLMITTEGPKVIEYNCRMGDPEAQVVFPLLISDIIPTIWDACAGKLGGHKVEVSDKSSVCVILASEGYPVDPITKRLMSSLYLYADGDRARVFHSGTAPDDKGRLITAGGRVVGVTSLGDDINHACEQVYSVVDNVYFEGMQFRIDIAKRERERFRSR